MKKYKLFKFGHCYINEQGDFVIGLVSGNKWHGYTFIASHAHPNVMLGKIHVQSRMVPNDGHWIEVTPEMYNIAASFHVSGYKVTLPIKHGKRPAISKY
jgi:hypothetical protein